MGIAPSLVMLSQNAQHTRKIYLRSYHRVVLNYGIYNNKFQHDAIIIKISTFDGDWQDSE